MPVVHWALTKRVGPRRLGVGADDRMGPGGYWSRMASNASPYISVADERQSCRARRPSMAPLTSSVRLSYAAAMSAKSVLPRAAPR